MRKLWIDLETYSECDLRTAGAHRYAEHPSTEIVLCQYAVDDGDPVVIDCTGRHVPAEVVWLLNADDTVLAAHNAAFEQALLAACWGVSLPPERWRCTMAQGLAHGLPGGLAAMGAALGVGSADAKDTRGFQLIMLFCKPRPKNMKLRRATKHTHPKEWAEFVEYARQDIVSMRAVAALLPDWNYRGAELALWALDQTINQRGFQVDLDLARAAVVATETEQKRLKAETAEATDGLVSSPSKRADLMAFILAEHGVELPDMRADTLRRMLDGDIPDGVRELILMRLEATKTSTAKYTALLRATCADGRLRGGLQFCGAARTGRWSGRLFQPQNLPRPSQGHDQDADVTAIKGGYAALAGNAMQMASDSLRGAIVAQSGRKLVAADLANIEGRMLAFLAGESWKLQAFRDYDAGTGPDLYVLAYARAFNLPVPSITKAQRQIGKVLELSMGYQGGVGAFLNMAAVYGMDLDELADAVHSSAPRGALAAAYRTHEWADKKGLTKGLPQSLYVACETLKAMWRQAHPATEALWGAAESAVRNAISSPGVACKISDSLVCRVDGAWLRIRLPSGRYLCYLHPRLADSGEISYVGVHQFTRKWARLKTYGGKLVENCTQAAARDALAYCMPAIEAAGYSVVLTVHDELITEPPDSPEFSAEDLSRRMAEPLPWAPGLPLAAEGFEAYRYRK